MLEKMSNGIMFAVIGFGGFLGIGEKYHAIPWSALDYDEDKGGYVVPFTKEQLEGSAFLFDQRTDQGRRHRRARRLLRILQGRSVLVSDASSKSPAGCDRRGFSSREIYFDEVGRVGRRYRPASAVDCTTS